MPKPIALFDIDNTLYKGFSYFELLAYQVNAGLLEQEVLNNANASMEKYKAKQQDYEATVIELLNIYAAGLKGARYATVLQTTKDFYRQSEKFFAYARPTMQQLHISHHIALVTGEPQFVAQAVGELFDVHTYYSSVFEVGDGMLTGQVVSYLASRHEKHSAIQHLMQRHGAKRSFAFGDSEGDIEMLRAVENPICLNPTDGLRAIATKEGWHMPDILEVAALVDKLS